MDKIPLSICSKKDEVLQHADCICSRDFYYPLLPSIYNLSQLQFAQGLYLFPLILWL